MPRSLFAATVRHGGRLVGMGRVVGDGLHVQVVDVAVHPSRQGDGLSRLVLDTTGRRSPTSPQRWAQVKRFPSAGRPANRGGCRPATACSTIRPRPRFSTPRRGAQPLRTFTEPVRLLRPLEDFAFGRWYIKALGDPRKPAGPDAFWDAADRYRDHPAWRYLEHPSNHMIPQHDPAGLAAMLLDLQAVSDTT